MKTGKLEKLLLLEQSGELSFRQRRRLIRELAVSDEARRVRAELSILSSSIRLPDAEPSLWAVARIVSRLREDTCPSSIRLSRILKPVLALAASLVLMMNAWNFHGGQALSTSVAAVTPAGVDVWNDPFEEDLSRLENLIGTLSGSPLDIMEM